jgi:hypothetical protein
MRKFSIEDGRLALHPIVDERHFDARVVAAVTSAADVQLLAHLGQIEILRKRVRRVLRARMLK